MLQRCISGKNETSELNASLCHGTLTDVWPFLQNYRDTFAISVNHVNSKTPENLVCSSSLLTWTVLPSHIQRPVSALCAKRPDLVQLCHLCLARNSVKRKLLEIIFMNLLKLKQLVMATPDNFYHKLDSCCEQVTSRPFLQNKKDTRPQ